MLTIEYEFKESSTDKKTFLTDTMSDWRFVRMNGGS